MGSSTLSSWKKICGTWFEFCGKNDSDTISSCSTHPASWIVGNLFLFYAGLNWILFFFAKQKNVVSRRQDKHLPQQTRRTSSPWTALLVSLDQSVKVEYSKRLMCHTFSLLKILWNFVEMVFGNTPESAAKCQILSIKHLLSRQNSLFTGPSMAPDHRKQIDNLKKFSVDFRVSVSFILTVSPVTAVSASSHTFISLSVAV